MRLAIDIGNTAAKWAVFEGRNKVAGGRWQRAEGVPAEVEDFLAKGGEAMLCASGEVEGLLADVPRLTADAPMPIKIGYSTPATLGPDRIAAACGAHCLHPDRPCLVVDAGTCITVDFVAADGTFHGGAIMPGLAMELSALHTMTAKLPLVDIGGVERAPVLGRTTEECIVAGTLGATMLALAGFVALYKEKAPGLAVVLTGGDAQQLMAAGATGWEHEPDLTLIGLRGVMSKER